MANQMASGIFTITNNLTFDHLKKLVAISFITILLFNWGGYRFMVNYLQASTDARIQSIINDKQYGQSELFEISAPVTLPYTTNWADWESVEGQIVINGFHYNYVERKLQDGVMTYRCLPNHDKQNLLTGRDAFFKLASDFENSSAQSGKKSGTSIAVNNYIGDYDDASSAYVIAPFKSSKQITFSNFASVLQNGFNGLVLPPPKC